MSTDCARRTSCRVSHCAMGTVPWLQFHRNGLVVLKVVSSNNPFVVFPSKVIVILFSARSGNKLTGKMTMSALAAHISSSIQAKYSHVKWPGPQHMPSGTPRPTMVADHWHPAVGDPSIPSYKITISSVLHPLPSLGNDATLVVVFLSPPNLRKKRAGWVGKTSTLATSSGGRRNVLTSCPLCRSLVWSREIGKRLRVSPVERMTYVQPCSFGAGMNQRGDRIGEIC